MSSTNTTVKKVIIPLTNKTVPDLKKQDKIPPLIETYSDIENDVNINPQRFKDVGISYKGFRYILVV